MTPTGYSEDALVEQPAIALLAELGWETVNAFGEFDHGASTLGWETREERKKGNGVKSLFLT